jgi:hypothetical protein
LPKKLSDSPAGWIRVYPYVLEGDDKLKKTGDAPELADLRADAQEWYPGVLRLGAAVQALDELAAAGVPKDAATATVCVERIRALRTTWGDLQCVRERTAALRQLAAKAFELLYEVSKLSAQFAGKLTLLGEGRARIVYEFDDPKELGDWVKQPGYLADWRADFAPVAKAEAQSTLSIVGGAALGTGAACYRLGLTLREPLVARYTVRYGNVPVGGSNEAAEMLFVCDDGKLGNIGIAATGCLRVADPNVLGVAVDAPPPFTFDTSHDYEVEVRVAGKQASSFVDGKHLGKLEIGTRTGGEVLLAVHSDCAIRFQRVEVEGVLDFDIERAQWIESQVAALGF